MKKVTLETIREARERIKGLVKKTDLLETTNFSEMTGANIFFKCENLQKTGSFKIRGAYNKILNLSDEEKSKGIIASSAGNHAQGVALSARISGIKSTIVMPVTAPISKISATKEYGAEVILSGEVFDDAYAKAREIQKETGATFIHAFDDEYVISGQGTIALEIFEQLDNKVDTIICPIGGGGLIAGIAIAAKALNPNIKIIGVESENVASMKTSIDNKKITTEFKGATIADGIAVKTPGEMTYDIIKEYVDEIIVVSEVEISRAILYMMERQKIVSEGSGGVATAALLFKKYIPNKGENVVSIVSGGNIDTSTLHRIINFAMVNEGRIFAFKTYLPDKPGSMTKISAIISGSGANIILANQNKLYAGIKISDQSMEFIIETFDFKHIEDIKKAIEDAGFPVKPLDV